MLSKKEFQKIAENPRHFPQKLFYIYYNENKLENAIDLSEDDFYHFFYRKYNMANDIQNIIADILYYFSLKLDVPLSRRVFLLDANNNLIKELDVLKA